jgi:hypothetical protein
MFIGGVSEESVAEMMQKCFSRTLVARVNAGSNEYEARRCITLETDRAATEGEWTIKITGAMHNSGKVEIDSGGKGTWKGEANMEGVKIIQTGPAEIVSGGGKCLLRIKTSNATGIVGDQEVTMPGMTNGDLPIQILD